MQVCPARVGRPDYTLGDWGGQRVGRGGDLPVLRLQSQMIDTSSDSPQGILTRVPRDSATEPALYQRKRIPDNLDSRQTLM
jgi:hypothetical protein